MSKTSWSWRYRQELERRNVELDKRVRLLEHQRKMFVEAIRFGHPAPDGGGSCPLESGECGLCALRDCPHQELLHYHHDGCPMCDTEAT